VNAFAGLLNAHYDGGPVLLITGASSPSILGRGGFQDLNQVALARPLCKRACKSNSAIIPQEIHESLLQTEGLALFTLQLLLTF